MLRKYKNICELNVSLKEDIDFILLLVDIFVSIAF